MHACAGSSNVIAERQTEQAHSGAPLQPRLPQCALTVPPNPCWPHAADPSGVGALLIRKDALAVARKVCGGARCGIQLMLPVVGGPVPTLPDPAHISERRHTGAAALSSWRRAGSTGSTTSRWGPSSWRMGRCPSSASWLFSKGACPGWWQGGGHACACGVCTCGRCEVVVIFQHRSKPRLRRLPPPLLLLERQAGCVPPAGRPHSHRAPHQRAEGRALRPAVCAAPQQRRPAAEHLWEASLAQQVGASI